MARLNLLCTENKCVAIQQKLRAKHLYSKGLLDILMSTLVLFCIATVISFIAIGSRPSTILAREKIEVIMHCNFLHASFIFQNTSKYAACTTPSADQKLST